MPRNLLPEDATIGSKSARISDSLVASGTLRMNRVASGVREEEAVVVGGVEVDSLDGLAVRSCGGFS